MKKVAAMIVMVAAAFIGQRSISWAEAPEKPEKVEICHFGGEEAMHIIRVSEKALPAHIGDEERHEGHSNDLGSDYVISDEDCGNQMDDDCDGDVDGDDSDCDE